MEKRTKLNQWQTVSKQKLAELQLIKDEHVIFEGLIRETDFKFIEGKKYADRAEIIDVINRSEKRNNYLIDTITQHVNQLESVFNIENTFDNEEQNHVRTHKLLLESINNYSKNYKQLKMQLVDILSTIKKEEKIRGFLNRRDSFKTAI